MFYPHSWIRSKPMPFGLAPLAITAIALLWLLTGAPGFAQEPHQENPFANATMYVNPDYTAEVATAIAQQAAGSKLAQQMTVVGQYPTAVWMDRMAAIAGGSSNNGRLGLEGHIQAALTQQAANPTKPIVMVLVIYDLPDRDCAALASNGEIPATGLSTYENNYITPIVNILKTHANDKVRFVLIVEDDSLPNLITNTGEAPNSPIPNCVTANGGVTGAPSLTGVYVQAIQFDLNMFHPQSNIYNYLDTGHHGWLGWAHNFNSAVPFLTQVAAGTNAGLASVDGFYTNAANYGPLTEPFFANNQQVGGQPVNSATFYSFNSYVNEIDYAQGLDQAFIAQGFPSTLGFLIDTSRNGWGGPNRPKAASTSTDVNTFVNASKIDLRDSMGQWCNQQGSGIGVPPTVSPGAFPNLQAYVWIKPPGESDGNYPGSTFGGVTSTTGDPNCDPAHVNALANNMLTDALPNSPKAGTFWLDEFNMLVQNADPPIASITNGFTLNATGATVMQGTSGTSSVTVNSIGNFSGTVDLSVSGLPTGVTAIFNPASITGSAGSTLTFTASNTATVGPATVTVTGTSGSTTETATLTLNVTAEPQFTVSASPAALTVAPGTQSSTTLTITCVGGLSGSVSLSAGTPPAGVQVNFSPSSVNCPGGTISANVFVQNGTSAGTSNLTLTATNGSITHAVTIALTIPGSGFTLSPSPTTVSLTPGGSATDTITITPSGGFNGSVTLSASGLPNGVTASFATNPATTSSVMTLAAASTAASGMSTITISGTSGSATNSTTITLNVRALGFTLSASPSTLTVIRGASATDTITVTPASGFTGSVTLAASGLPTGVTASFGTNPTTGTSVLTLTASSTATTGTKAITITGTSGSTTATTTLSLTVNPVSGFTLSASPSTLTVIRGASATDTITVTPASGFTGSVTLAASGLPTGVTASFGTNPTTGTSVLTLTASSTATTGTKAITITGTSGSTTATTTLSLTVNPVSGFTLSASPSTLTVIRGASATDTITVTPTSGFTGSVTLAASGLPTGVTASFGTNPTTGTSVLTLTASSTATTGTKAITITGTSGSTTATTTLSLTVNPVGTTVTITPVVSSNSPYFVEEDVKVANTAPVTALSITITVARTTGISLSGEYNTVGGIITQADSSTSSTLTYTFTLNSGQTLSPGSYIFAAQMSGTGTAHPTSGDTFTVTSTAGGTTTTQTGHF